MPFIDTALAMFQQAGMPVRLVLGSASPRRAALLTELGVDFVVQASDVPEVPAAGEGAREFSRRVAAEKARAVARERDGDRVLAADTVVVVGEEILGKPGDAAEARRMLRKLSGRRHRVITAVAFTAPGGDLEEEFSVESAVEFRRLTDEEIDAYVAGGEPLDKAGAYAIQGGARGFVAGVNGSYSNVIGLPLDEVRALLERHGLLRDVARLSPSVEPRGGSKLTADRDIAANVAAVRERIAGAAGRSGREPGSVRLIAAAKTKGPGMVAAALAAGVTDIGENYVQEAAAKKAAVKGTADWHMIGRLQRNKAGRAVEVFSSIQSVDSIGLGEALARQGERRGQAVRVLVEVNLGDEATKTGVRAEEVDELVGRLRALPGLAVEGLMTVPPPGTPESARSYFRRLREIGERLGLPELSMGMTEDFEVAIEEGATMVRIGRAIFGERR